MNRPPRPCSIPFFVRHAYFTGAEEFYERLKRALRAEIDESAWSTLYSTTRRPFDRPAGRKIAVKVINHYGNEVLKVFDVRPAWHARPGIAPHVPRLPQPPNH